ncbi:glycosyltransferase [bacterium]|nr:glycosyltransferase [bacterium]
MRNPDRKTPYALNIGLREAVGEYVAFLGAHNVYDTDYISTCLQELNRTGATGCSGRVVVEAANRSLQARLIKWMMKSSFGAPGFRTQNAGYSDSVAFPVFRKAPLLELGGYDERLHRNQDNDMNERLHAAGHAMYVTDKTKVVYIERGTIKEAVRYAFRSGLWNTYALKINARSMKLRHFVPAVFTLLVGVGVILKLLKVFVARLWLRKVCRILELVIPLHLAVGACFAAGQIRESRSAAMVLLVPLFLVHHLAYGTGSILGFLYGRKGDEGSRTYRTNRLPQ